MMVVLYIKPAGGAICISIEPIFQAFWMKYMLTWNFVYHLTTLDLVKANGTLFSSLKLYLLKHWVYMPLYSSGYSNAFNLGVISTIGVEYSESWSRSSLSGLPLHYKLSDSIKELCSKIR
jgi:hypothetical protein